MATQSKFLAVGSVVPWAEPHVGAIATQSYANPQYGPDGLRLLRDGLSAEEVVARLTEADDGREQRQLGVVDAAGGAASFTGGGCHAWAGGRTGNGYAAQGNILVSGETVDALAERFEATRGAPLAERLLDSLDAAQAAGGDSRGQQSAALLVVERSGGYAGLSDLLVDLRVDDHVRPLEELRRLYGLHQALFGRTPQSAWIAVDAELAAEIEERLATLGYEGELADAFAALVRKREPGGTRRRRRAGRPGRARRAEEGDMSQSYNVIRFEELESFPVGEHGLHWHPIRSRLGVQAFGINSYTAAESGGEIVEDHTEETYGHEEIYIVVSGHARFTLDGGRGRRPRRNDRPPARSERAAARGRSRARHEGPRRRRQAG